MTRTTWTIILTIILLLACCMLPIAANSLVQEGTPMGCRRDQHYFGQDLVLVDVVGTEDVILYKATDQGWHKLTSPQGTELRVTPDKTLYIFNAESHQIYRSTDVGENWSLIATAPVFTESQTATRGFYPTPLPDVFLLRVIHEPLGAAGQQGIYKSADGGTTWKKVLEGNGWDVAVSPSFAQDGIALASLRGYKLSFGIWKTTDWGETWQPSSNGLLVGMDLTGYNTAISPQFAQDETVFAASGIGVYKSIDGGNSWTMLLSPDDLSYLPHDLVLSPDYINVGLSLKQADKLARAGHVIGPVDNRATDRS